MPRTETLHPGNDSSCLARGLWLQASLRVRSEECQLANWLFLSIPQACCYVKPLTRFCPAYKKAYCPSPTHYWQRYSHQITQCALNLYKDFIKFLRFVQCSKLPLNATHRPRNTNKKTDSARKPSSPALLPMGEGRKTQSLHFPFNTPPPTHHSGADQWPPNASRFSLQS